MVFRFFLPCVLAVSSVCASPHCALKRSETSITTTARQPLAPPEFVASTWFAGWHANTGFPVSSISWDKYTHLTYAFAETAPDVHTLSLTPEDERIIPEFVDAAHAHNISVSISVGGWTGSRFFSTAVATAANRTAFVNTLSDFVAKYKFDGVDFDWEYPNNQGIGCNTISSKDTANLLLLLKQLRSTSSTKDLILSAATAINPFMDNTGSPSSNVSPFAEVLDFIEIMNYDIWGSWSTAVGPNAPLDDTCAPDAQGSAKSAVTAWTAAGFPASKIVLGVGSYGHSFKVLPTNAVKNGELVAYPSFAQEQPTGDAWDDAPGPDVCGVQQPAGGNFDFWGLVDAGFLTTTGKPAEGIDYRFDKCSQTAYVYNSTSQIEVSFDDVPAFTAKGAYIASAGLRGFAMWEAGGDYQDMLLDAIHEGGGAKVVERVIRD